MEVDKTLDTAKDRQDLLMPWFEMTRFWSELEPASKSDLLQGAALLEFEQGEFIDIELGLIISGTAGIQYALEDGRRSIAELFRSGDLVSMRRCVQSRHGRLVALGYCGVLSLKDKDFATCSRLHNDIVEAYRRQVANQTGRLRDHINDLAVKSPLERIVSVLFELRRWPDANVGEAAETALPILRKDIAAYLGIRPETLSRVLRRLLEKGLISATENGDVIRLENIAALRDVANGKCFEPEDLAS